MIKKQLLFPIIGVLIIILGWFVFGRIFGIFSTIPSLLIGFIFIFTILPNKHLIHLLVLSIVVILFIPGSILFIIVSGIDVPLESSFTNFWLQYSIFAGPIAAAMFLYTLGKLLHGRFTKKI